VTRHVAGGRSASHTCAVQPAQNATVPTKDGSKVPIGIVTVSDRASKGIYQDQSGPGIVAALQEFLITPWRPVARMVPDEQSQIERVLTELADNQGCCLVLTAGGTGPAARDVTPEATEAVCGRTLPGFGELMRKASLEQVPTAILSRQIAGTRGRTLIINLPGRPSSIRTCLNAVFPAVPYCLDLLGGYRLDTDPFKCRAFRPSSAA
jgi:molybdopterin adenylyltransferase